MITIVGLGEKKDDITLLGKRAIESAKCVVVRTSKQAFGIKYHVSLDDLYVSAADYEEFNNSAADTLLQLHKQYGDIVYAVAGDGFCDSSVERLYGVSAPITHIAGASINRCAATSIVQLSAYDLSLLPQLDNLPLMIHSLDTALIASEVKLYLLGFYPFDTPTIFYTEKRAQKITLEDLDRQPKYGAFCKAFIATSPTAKLAFFAANPTPNADFCAENNTLKAGINCANNCAKNTDIYACNQAHNLPQNKSKIIDKKSAEFDKMAYTFGDLVRIMRLLTSSGGCPWDIAQTHQSIRSNMLEEAYEAVAAIDSGDTDNLIEELGDVMLQSVFHADIARRHGDFELSDIITALCRKLYTRHTHIFGDKTAVGEADALKNWEESKAKEKSTKSQQNSANIGESLCEKAHASAEEKAREIKAEIAQKYKGLPAAMRAQKTLKKLAKSGIISLDDLIKNSTKDKIKIAVEAQAKTDKNLDFGRKLFEVIAACEANGIDAEVELNSYLNKLLNY